MIERFLSTYKDGFEVYLNPSEKDQIIEEIERLNKMLEETIKEYEHKQYITDLITENGIICKKNKEIERLHSIIKEVREWIRIVQTNEDKKHFEPIINTDELDYILEILDKENEK